LRACNAEGVFNLRCIEREEFGDCCCGGGRPGDGAGVPALGEDVCSVESVSYPRTTSSLMIRAKRNANPAILESAVEAAAKSDGRMI
jgi:hypothetical protein